MIFVTRVRSSVTIALVYYIGCLIRSLVTIALVYYIGCLSISILFFLISSQECCCWASLFVMLYSPLRTLTLFLVSRLGSTILYDARGIPFNKSV